LASPLPYLQILFRDGSFAGQTDGALLERFLGGPPDVAEAAFEALVERHGVMVRRICHRVTGDRHDAEDAAQATFLVLARSARSVRSSDSIAPWLRGVARRVSARANADTARRRARERRAAEQLAAEASSGGERRPEIREELARLPERYRLPIVLCYLEGLSYVQAAHRLGCPVRTLQTRLARGRERLRSGLMRRGLGPVAGSLIAAPAAWAQATARLAMLWSTKGGPATAGAVPAAAALAVEGVRAMIVHKLKIAGSLALIATVAGTWAWTGFYGMPPAAARAVEPDRRAPGPDVALKGWVVGPDGKPLAGAKLTSPMLKIREQAAKTDAEGGFTVTAEEAPRGEFALRVEAPGLASKIFTIKMAPDPPKTAPLDPTEPAAAPYVMGPTGEIGPALEMTVGSVVAGRVVREGRPVAGVTVGLWRDVHGFEVFLGSTEARTDGDGRFRFPHGPTNMRCWVYVPTGSLERAGAVRPQLIRTPGDDASIDLGDIAVEPGRTVSGRVVFADGKPWPANAEVLASADHADGSIRTKPDRSGRFTLAGLPQGQVSICGYFPDDKSYAPAGYHVSARNLCLDPLNPWLLVGRVDGDVADLTILFEPGEQPPPSFAPAALAAFKEAQAGPVTGVPPGPR
jgi:RNA polymerase sigma factor (sigma-70 family)